MPADGAALLDERGIAVRESKTTTAHDHVNLITVRAAGHALAGTLRSEHVISVQGEVVRREQGTLRWPVVKEALWLRAPLRAIGVADPAERARARRGIRRRERPALRRRR